MPDQKNFILAIALSILILFTFQYLFPTAPVEPPRQQTEQTAGTDPAVPTLETAPLPGEAIVTPQTTRTDALAAAPRIRIDTPRLHGSLSLVGGRIDDVTLADYRRTVDPDSPEIVLLSPRAAPRPYYADFGWAGENVSTPGPDTQWEADGDRLSVGNPVTLTWSNAAGLVFEREIAVDGDFMFTIAQRVANRGDTPATLAPYGRVQRFGTPDTLGFYILHEGAYGVFDGTLDEFSYDELQDEGTLARQSQGGWLGFTDKYWMVALVPDQAVPFTAQLAHRTAQGDDRYLTTLQTEAVALAPGDSFERTSHLFAGAKEVTVIEGYEENLGIEKFFLAVDWGWFSFLTRPIFHGLSFVNGIVGNFGVAILILTVFIKLLLFPLANKSYRSMAKMKALAPEMKKLKERHGDDRQQLNQEMMQLYKKEKVNPASGCLPIVVQIPVFFALYKVLFVTIEMRHAPFFGWIQDLSAPDPTSLFNLFGLIPFTPPELLLIGGWPLIMGITMFLQQKLNPPPPDPIQAKIFALFPFVFTVMLARFPAGLVIYWAWNNLLSISQQWVIMRSVQVKAGDAVAPAGGPHKSANGKAEEPEAATTATEDGSADDAEPGTPEPKPPPPRPSGNPAARRRKGRSRPSSRRRN
ncbi:MAG: membrane protein insertase YidC [Inquilinus sp.]|nr:membrane protein insertase YidC [Inquilinus sp.]